jgi:hypothetical protein
MVGSRDIELPNNSLGLPCVIDAIHCFDIAMTGLVKRRSSRIGGFIRLAKRLSSGAVRCTEDRWG